MHKIITQTLTSSFILFWFACSNQVDPVICTDEFVILNVTVVDDKGLPADSVNIVVTNKRNGQIYDLTDMNSPHLAQRGEYTIFHDGYRDQIRWGSERIIVEGEKGALVGWRETCDEVAGVEIV